MPTQPILPTSNTQFWCSSYWIHWSLICIEKHTLTLKSRQIPTRPDSMCLCLHFPILPLTHPTPMEFIRDKRRSWLLLGSWVTYDGFRTPTINFLYLEGVAEEVPKKSSFLDRYQRLYYCTLTWGEVLQLCNWSMLLFIVVTGVSWKQRQVRSDWRVGVHGLSPLFRKDVWGNHRASIYRSFTTTGTRFPESLIRDEKKNNCLAYFWPFGLNSNDSNDKEYYLKFRCNSWVRTWRILEMKPLW